MKIRFRWVAGKALRWGLSIGLGLAVMLKAIDSALSGDNTGLIVISSIFSIVLAGNYLKVAPPDKSLLSIALGIFVPTTLAVLVLLAPVGTIAAALITFGIVASTIYLY